MASNTPLLPGRVQPDETAKLRRRIEKLEAELKHTQSELDAYRQAATLAEHRVNCVRVQMKPWYEAMTNLFEEIGEPLNMEATATPPGSPPSTPNTSLEAWKQKLGGQHAQILEAFQIHGPLSIRQLMTIIHRGQTTVTVAISKLKNLQLVDKVGDKYALKQP